MLPGLKKRSLSFHDVLMYLALGRKHLRLMTLLICLSLTAGLVYYVWARPVYYSKSLVDLDYTPLPLDTSKVFQDGRVMAVMKELQAPHIVERTAKKLGLKASSREIQRNYVLKTTLRRNSEKNLEIEVWPTRPELAKVWAPTLVSEFLSYRKEKRIKDTQELIDAFQREVEDVRKRMKEALDRRFEFIEERDVTKAQIESEKWKNVPAELVRIGRRINEMGRVKLKLEDPSLSAIAKLSLIESMQEDPLSSLSQLTVGDQVQTGEKDVDDDGKPNSHLVIVPPALVTAQQAWRDLERELRRINGQILDASRTYLPGHRTMVALNKERESIEQKLEVEYGMAKARFDLEYQDLINKRTELESKLPEITAINKQAANIRQDDDVRRMGTHPWKRYLADLQKRIEALDYVPEKERVDLNFLGVVELRETPVSPNKMKLFVYSLVFGLLLAIGTPFLLEYLDHTVSNFEQVESTFQLRGLGIVPKVEGQSSGMALPDREETKAANLIENFRVIRTNVISMGALSKGAHVMMVTSAMPKEGKTLVSSNLAISFAQTGARTLLMDTDLRRGRMHRLFGYRKSPGLSNVLLNEVALEDACRPTTHENLHVLSAGKHLETGTELLGSPKFTELMARLREKYDHIVMDTPPVLGLSETALLQKAVDGVLFVIWSGRTPMRSMQAAIESLQANGANFYGFVLNRLDLSATQNYYQYYYYSYDYYYHYSPRELEKAS